MAHHDSIRAHEAVEYLQPQLPPELRKPLIGIVCGSGLGGLANMLLEQPQVAVSYSNVPHFANSTGRCSHQQLVSYKAWPSQHSSAERCQCPAMLES